ncbi:hypothetical protein OPQ81_001160 [Rhizoctonia solani]|nr:hypothetical protein OPQ81_001160 [Rhizoctonia solani]
MNANTHQIKHQRKLVIVFRVSGYSVPLESMIQNDQNTNSQLVHDQRLDWMWEPSRKDRLLIRLKLKKLDPQSEIDQAMKGAYEFICEKYQPGDDVILMFDGHKSDPRPMGAAELLARHLCEGTRPPDFSKAQSNAGGNIASRRIPIHCVAEFFWSSPKITSVSNDELRSRFPLGTEHVICYVHDPTTGGTESYSTTYDADGSIISREVLTMGLMIRCHSF